MLFTLFKKDLKLLFSLKKTLFLVGLGLVIFFAMTFVYKDTTLQQGILDQVKVGLVDEENSTLSRMLLQNFKTNEAFSRLFAIQSGTEKVLLDAYNQNELTAIVYIPAGFTDSLLHYENKAIRILLNPHNPLKNQVLVATLSSFSEYIASVDSATYNTWTVLRPRLPEAEVIRMNELYSVEMISFALNRQQFFDFKPITTIPSASPQVYFFLSIIIILSSFLSIQGAIQLYDEVDQKCLQRYYFSPRSKEGFIISKLLAVLTLNLSLLFCVSAVVSYLAHLSVLKYVPFLALTLLTFTAIALSLAALIPSRNVLLNGLSLMFLLFAIIGGSFIPLQLLPESIQLIARLTPHYWLFQFGLYTLKGYPLPVLSLIILSAFDLLLLAVLPLSLRRKGASL